MKTLLYAVLFTQPLLLVGAPRAHHEPQRQDKRDDSRAIRLKPVFNISKQTQSVSCWDKRNNFTGSLLVRTPIFVSSDGSHRAYLEVEATAFQPRDSPTYAGPLCENTSRLFFAGSGETKFRLVFSQSSEDFSDGNSLTLVDWSSDGTRLLLERTQWKYESEGDYTDFVVFNANSGTITKPDLEAVIAALFGKDCGSENSALGFMPEGRVVLALAPLTDEIALMNGAKSCVKRKTFLAVDISHGQAASTAPLAASFKAAKNGKFLDSASR